MTLGDYFFSVYNRIMQSIITTQTIKEGGGGITNPEHADGKIKIKPTRRKK